MKYHIHTAKKEIITEDMAKAHASYISGVTPSGNRYLEVKYIDVEYDDGTIEKLFPKR